MKNRPRTCLGCRAKSDKKSLLRVVRIINCDGAKIIKFDPEAKLQGRGAWVCRKRECIEKVKKNHAFERVLKANIVESIYEELSCTI
ncbi:MAG: YlxR family protein [Synergistaceae bacterium]|nr:YlxR family protein [Synergistaceae bacterium]